MLAIYRGNPDQHVAFTRAAMALKEHFTLHIVSTNYDKRAFVWPRDIEIERIGFHIPFGDRRLRWRLASMLEHFLFLWVVFNRIRSLRPDLVYAHDAEAFVAATTVRRWFSFPLVYENHDQVEPESCSRFSLRRQVELKALQRGPTASLVVYPEKGRADYYLERSGDTRKPLVWPYYTSLKLVSLPSDLNSLIEARYERRELLYTGVIHDEIAGWEAAQALKLLGDGYRLTMYGAISTDDAPHLRALADSLALGDRLFHGGWLNQDEMVSRTMYGSLGLVLFKPDSLNYRTMGTSTNKLYEYAARGIPVIVPDVKSFRDALSNEPWVAYVDIKDPESIARGVRWFLEDIDRYRSASKAARVAFEERFNFEAVFPALLERLLPLVHPVVRGCSLSESKVEDDASHSTLSNTGNPLT